MDRRSFVAGVGAAALGGVLAREGSAQQPEPGRSERSAGKPALKPIRIAVKYGMIQAGQSVREKFEIARDAGFEGIEMPAPSQINLDEVRDARDATGLAIPGVVNSVHWNKPLSDPDPAVRAKGVSALEAAIRQCEAIGGGSVLLVPAVVNKQVSYADAYARSQAEIARVLPLARESGVRIAIENVWNSFLLSPLEAARYTDEIGADVMGWHFDVGNIVNYGWPEHWVRTLGDRIIRLDVKEYSRKRRDDEGLWKGFGVEIGEGDCDWPAVMEALNEIGYNGWACAEVGGGGPDRLADIANRMSKVLAR